MNLAEEHNTAFTSDEGSGATGFETILVTFSKRRVPGIAMSGRGLAQARTHAASAIFMPSMAALTMPPA